MTHARFVNGSIMRHILIMTGSSSIGLMALFLVDFLDIYFLSLLEDIEVTAGIGFASTIIFFTASISIGLMIAMSALVARNVGARKGPRARALSTNIFAYSLFVVSALAFLVWINIDSLLLMLGAEGRTLNLAASYLRIVVASMPVIGIAIVAGGLLRALGDAKRSMLLTVAAALANGILDPIFIFGLDMGIEGAAWATVISRFIMLGIGVDAILRVHKMLAPFSWKHFKLHTGQISAIAIPAMLTNIATPIGAAIVVGVIAKFGDEAVAGMSIVTRLNHVVFAVIFALSGVVGPIIGQNLGSRHFDRIRRVFLDSMTFTALYVGAVSLLLFLGKNLVVEAFHAEGETADLIRLYCTYLAITFIFAGAMFVANASFNNLGRPIWSTLTNFGRATLGTIPFVYAGAALMGPAGVLIGHTIGGILFGIGSFWLALRLANQMAEGKADIPGRKRPKPIKSAS